MLKQIVKIILLYFINKRRSVVSHTSTISLKTIIGKNSIINKHSELDADCKIGSRVYIGKSCYLTKVTIGNYCSIANNVSIGQGEHDLSKISTNSLFYNDAYHKLTKKICIIGHDVWIGVDAIILRDVKIGNGAVIGANSVVTKDVPAYAVVVGSPAKVIKYRFSDLKIKNIEKSKWWNYDLEVAKKIINKLEEVNI